MLLSIPSHTYNDPRMFAPRCNSDPSIASWADAKYSRIRYAVYRWEESKPDKPAPPIMGQIDRINRIVDLTGKWPLNMYLTAEKVGYELPEPQENNRIETMVELRDRCRAYKYPSGFDGKNALLEEEWELRTEEEKARPMYPDQIVIIDPQINEALGWRYQIRHPNTLWWVEGEARNRYVPAGDGILFRRDENIYNVPLSPLPSLPEESKKWSWRERNVWTETELSKIPKKKVTVICEYGSRRCVEGEPVLDYEGKVIRHRWAGEWRREMVAFLEGTPSPFFFDDFTGHPQPIHSSRAREFRQEVADVAFILMNL